MTGKPQVFSDAENNLLRTALRKFRDTNKLTQVQVGNILGIEQQNAGRLLGKAKAGMSRETANRFARTIGFRDAEHFLLENGVLAALNEPPSGNAWASRDAAVSIARSLGCVEAAIHAVITRFDKIEHQAKLPRWWIEQIVLESFALRTEAPMPPSAVEKKLAKKTQRAG